jgi:proline utilization trans-activator
VEALEQLAAGLLPGKSLRDLDSDGIQRLVIDLESSRDKRQEESPTQPELMASDIDFGGDGSFLLDTNSHWEIVPEGPPIPPVLSVACEEAAPSLILPLKIPEGRLLPAPRGGYHYVGPASSIFFAMTVRSLVGRTNWFSFARDPDDVVTRWSKADEFTNFRVSATLEARITGLPTVRVTEGEEAGAADASGQQWTASELHLNAVKVAWQRRDWRAVLPERSETDKLVKAFFDRVHPNLNLFHRGSFYVRYESIWSENMLQESYERERISTIDRSWMFTLCMVLVLGALALESTAGLSIHTAELQQRYLALIVREGLPAFATTTNVANVQTLLLLALYQHNVGERNGAWLLIGQAARSAIALGMHRDGEPSRFDAIERHTRRLVWWALFSLEQQMSLILGRPSATDSIDISAELPDDEMNEGGGLPPQILQYNVQLVRLLARVKRLVACISTDFDKPDIINAYSNMGQQLEEDLADWRRSLPHFLLPDYNFATDRHRRAVLMLHVTADGILSILGRPFLLSRAEHNIRTQNEQNGGLIPNASVNQLADTALHSADAMLNNLHVLAHHDLLDGMTWIDLFHVHHATLILGIPYLSKSPEASEEGHARQQQVGGMLTIVQQIPIAPTYRILLNLATQFAYIVGMGPPSAVSHPTPSIQIADNALVSTEAVASAMRSTQVGFPPTGQDLGLDHFFGPHPSCHVSPADGFADLYSYGMGLDANGEVSWDFFNIMGLGQAGPSGSMPIP